MTELAPLHSSRITVIEPRRRGVGERAREWWAYRHLQSYFGRRYIQKRYARTLLGWVWVPLRPALTVVSRALIFGGVLAVPSGKVPYLVFLLVAAGAWQLFAETTYWATRSLELNRGLLGRMYVPRLVPLTAGVAVSLVEYLVYLAMTAIAILYYLVIHQTFFLVFSARTLLVPLGLVLIVLLGLGVGLWTSIYGIRVRDVRFALSYAMSFWYILTPVIYPLSSVPYMYRPLIELNPVTGPVLMVRDGLLGSQELTLSAALVPFGAVAFLWIGGLWWFARAEANALTDL